MDINYNTAKAGGSLIAGGLIAAAKGVGAHGVAASLGTAASTHGCGALVSLGAALGPVGWTVLLVGAGALLVTSQNKK